MQPPVQVALHSSWPASSCVTSTNSGWGGCDYASVTVNGTSCFDAVIQTDCAVLNLFLNPACNTKASCTRSYQCKHVFTLMPLYSSLLPHKWRKDTFILSQQKDHVSHWKQAGLERVNSAPKAGIAGKPHHWLNCQTVLGKQTLLFQINTFMDRYKRTIKCCFSDHPNQVIWVCLSVQSPSEFIRMSQNWVYEIDFENYYLCFMTEK